MTDKFCPQCGAPVEEGAVQCRYCREPLTNGQIVPQKSFQETEYQQTEDEGADVNANKIYAVIAYLGILVLIPILAAPKSAFARFHANQGLTLLLLSAVIGIADTVLGGGLFITLAMSAVRLFCIVLAIIGIVTAVQGQKKPLPVIGGVHLLK